MKATRSRILDSVGVQVGSDKESRDEVGELAFVPKGCRVVAKESQLDKMIVVEEDEGQVVEVLDDTEVHFFFFLYFNPNLD